MSVHQLVGEPRRPILRWLVGKPWWPISAVMRYLNACYHIVKWYAVFGMVFPTANQCNDVVWDALCYVVECSAMIGWGSPGGQSWYACMKVCMYDLVVGLVSVLRNGVLWTTPMLTVVVCILVSLLKYLCIVNNNVVCNIQCGVQDTNDLYIVIGYS